MSRIPVKTGLLPLYIQLYDDLNPAWRTPLEEFVRTLCRRLAKAGVEIEAAPVCRVKSEFRRAVTDLERKGCEALITLHLAYSPSLEAIDALAGTTLPLVVLDTTPDFAFGPEVAPERLMLNHGIHGVQDLCNLLRRRGKDFAIEAGHWERSDVLERVVRQVQAIHLTRSLRTARVGRIGRPFAGMGDFLVPTATLQRDLGVQTVAITPAALARLCPGAEDPQVAQELVRDRRAFDCSSLNPAVHRAAAQVHLGLQRCIQRDRLTAVTLNFQEVTRASGLPMMPFLGLCKSMAAGCGYAGEGDVLTAALVGSLLRVFPESSFAEMFCPDWKGGRVFLSHMGELNVAVAERKPLLYSPEKWVFSDAPAPVSVGACFRPGPALWVNLAPARQGYTLVVAPVTMVSGGTRPAFRKTIRGWMRPQLPLPEFLAAYSRVGGTHHAALVYGGSLKVLEGFSRQMGFDYQVLA